MATGIPAGLLWLGVLSASQGILNAINLKQPHPKELAE